MSKKYIDAPIQPNGNRSRQKDRRVDARDLFSTARLHRQQRVSNIRSGCQKYMLQLLQLSSSTTWSAPIASMAIISTLAAIGMAVGCV